MCIRDRLSGLDVLDHNPLVNVNLRLKEMTFQTEVLVLSRHFGDIDQTHSGHVILKCSGPDHALLNVGKSELGTDLLQQNLHWQELMHGHAEGDMFSCEGDVGLELAGPQDRTAKEGQNKSGPGFN